MDVAIKRPRSRVRAIVWGGLGLWAVVLAVIYVLRMPSTAQVGELLVPPGRSAWRPDGSRVRLIALDSPTVVLAATSECAACRQGIPTYREISDRLRAEGVAFRVMIGSDSLAARQFSRLLADPAGVVWDPDQSLFRELGVRAVPTMYLVSPNGHLLRAWAPFAAYAGAADTVSSAIRKLRMQVQ